MMTYTTLSDVQMELLSKRIIDLYGLVDSKMVDYVREALIRLVAMGNPDITVIITGRGGDGLASLDIYDMFMSYPGHITGRVFGNAKSADVLILQACDTRMAAQHAEIMIHNPFTPDYISWDVLNDAEMMAQIKNNLNIERNKAVQILLRSTELSLEKLNAIMEEGKDLTAIEALELGLIDSIIEPMKGNKGESHEE